MSFYTNNILQNIFYAVLLMLSYIGLDKITFPEITQPIGILLPTVAAEEAHPINTPPDDIAIYTEEPRVKRTLGSIRLFLPYSPNDINETEKVEALVASAVNMAAKQGADGLWISGIGVSAQEGMPAYVLFAEAICVNC